MAAEEAVTSAGSSAASNAASSAAVGGFLGFLNYNTAKRMAEFNYNQQMRYLEEAPSRQVAGYRAAGINPMLPYAKGNPGIGAATPAVMSDVWGSALNNASNWKASAKTVERMDAEIEKIEAEVKTEGFRAMLARNDVIKGNYDLQKLAGELDAAMVVTAAKNGPEAFAELKKPQIRAGLQELRAALASASNDAQVYEALNSKAVSLALEVLSRVSGSGSAIAGAVDRYRARSQRGDIINLNKE